METGAAAMETGSNGSGSNGEGDALKGIPEEVLANPPEAALAGRN